MDQQPRTPAGNPDAGADTSAAAAARGDAARGSVVSVGAPRHPPGSEEPGLRAGKSELPPPADDTPASPEVPIAPADPGPDRRPVPRAPGWASAFLGGLVMVVPGLAFLVSAEAAAWVLAGALVVVALLRLVTPAGGLFVARTRLTDVVLLLLLAAALSALVPWAATVDVGG